MMVETMGMTYTPKERIENLLHVKQTLFPEQPLDWEYLLDEFIDAPQKSRKKQETPTPTVIHH
jgi:hypothetical protein